LRRVGVHRVARLAGEVEGGRKVFDSLERHVALPHRLVERELESSQRAHVRRERPLVGFRVEGSKMWVYCLSVEGLGVRDLGLGIVV
jgi:hypothetical protein